MSSQLASLIWKLAVMVGFVVLVITHHPAAAGALIFFVVIGSLFAWVFS